MQARRPHAGFTLIEILVVIALIAVLAAVIAPNMLDKAGDAKTNAARMQLDKIASAIELYRLEVGRYPDRLEDLVEKPANADRWKSPYLKRSQLLDPWERELVYRRPGEHGAFDLLSYGGDGQPGGDGDDADIGSWE